MFEKLRRKRKEKKQAAVLEEIYSDLQKIKTSFQITVVPASEEREKEFDKEKRHQELLAAFRRSGLAMSEAASSRGGDKEKKGNWLTNLISAYFSYKVLKGFLKKFFKVMKLGRLWSLLRGAGLLLSRLFWPLALATALIWAIPKIIENWPAIVKTVKETIASIWTTIKGWLSFLGVDFDKDEDGTEEGAITEAERIALTGPDGDFTPKWDEAQGAWVVNNTPLAGIAKENEADAKVYASMMRAGTSVTAIQEAVGTQSIEPQQDILGDDIDNTVDNDLVDSIKSTTEFKGVAFQDDAGIWTVGYGHTGDGVMAGTTMTERAATTQLRTDLGSARSEAQTSLDDRVGQGSFAALGSAQQNNLTKEKLNSGAGSTSIAGSTGSNASTSSVASASTGSKTSTGSTVSRVSTPSSASPPISTGSSPSTGSSSSTGSTSSVPGSSTTSPIPTTMGSQQTVMPTITTPTPTAPPGQVIPKVTVIESKVDTDNSVKRSTTTRQKVSNKDYGTGNPFMGLYA